MSANGIPIMVQFLKDLILHKSPTDAEKKLSDYVAMVLVNVSLNERIRVAMRSAGILHFLEVLSQSTSSVLFTENFLKLVTNMSITGLELFSLHLKLRI